jgi:hypothetical protein
MNKKIIKTLEQFCERTNKTNLNNKVIRVETITYRSQGFKVKRCGYDIVDNDNNILLSFQPVDYRNGDKWLLRDGLASNRYTKRISQKYLETVSYAINPNKLRI